MKKISLHNILTDLSSRDNFVFLETNRLDSDNSKSYLFVSPKEVINCARPSGIRPSLDLIDRCLRKGYFAAGFISYEAGFVFEEALSAKADYNFPLLWFGIYKEPKVFDHRQVIFTDEKTPRSYQPSNLKPNITEAEYINSIGRIKSYIEEGDTYQVNYTFKLDFDFDGFIDGLYLDLRRKQSVPYSALIRFGKRYILSFSPELFFKKEKGRIYVRPMKGTAPRGQYLEEDEKNSQLLHISPKNRSENIMIVDLLRNDLGKVCRTDTVKTKRLFEVERYESLLQMTSTIEGRLKKGLSSYELFKALFPSGSVTGAPKIRTMQIIDELEKSPRHIYTGAIGFIGPDKRAVFNVAIRTVSIDINSKKGEMGIGSGIVYDSDAKKEYAECILKSKFLTDKRIDFQLIETMLWKGQKGCRLLNLHLERLSESCRYFSFRYDQDAIREFLHKESRRYNDDRDYRMRLLMDKEGGLAATSDIAKTGNSQKVVIFSDKAVSSSDIFLFHKTTNRNIYDEEYKKCKATGFYDIIFQNEKGEITEGAISNIFIRKDNAYYTPPIECGLLNGVMRRHIIKNNIFKVEEKILYKKDIESADELLLTNAVRGIVRAQLIRSGELTYA